MTSAQDANFLAQALMGKNANEALDLARRYEYPTYRASVTNGNDAAVSNIINAMSFADLLQQRKKQIAQQAITDAKDPRYIPVDVTDGNSIFVGSPSEMENILKNSMTAGTYWDNAIREKPVVSVGGTPNLSGDLQTVSPTGTAQTGLVPAAPTVSLSGTDNSTTNTNTGLTGKTLIDSVMGNSNGTFNPQQSAVLNAATGNTAVPPVVASSNPFQPVTENFGATDNGVVNGVVPANVGTSPATNPNTNLNTDNNTTDNALAIDNLFSNYPPITDSGVFNKAKLAEQAERAKNPYDYIDNPYYTKEAFDQRMIAKGVDDPVMRNFLYMHNLAPLIAESHKQRLSDAMNVYLDKKSTADQKQQAMATIALETGDVTTPEKWDMAKKEFADKMLTSEAQRQLWQTQGARNLAGGSGAGGGAGSITAAMASMEGQPYHYDPDHPSYTGCMHYPSLAYVKAGVRGWKHTDDIDAAVAQAKSLGILKNPTEYEPRPGDMLIGNGGHHTVLYMGDGKYMQAGESQGKVYTSDAPFLNSVDYIIAGSLLPTRGYGGGAGGYGYGGIGGAGYKPGKPVPIKDKETGAYSRFDRNMYLKLGNNYISALYDDMTTPEGDDSKSRTAKVKARKAAKASLNEFANCITPLYVSYLRETDGNIHEALEKTYDELNNGRTQFTSLGEDGGLKAGMDYDNLFLAIGTAAVNSNTGGGNLEDFINYLEHYVNASNRADENGRAKRYMDGDVNPNGSKTKNSGPYDPRTEESSDTFDYSALNQDSDTDTDNEVNDDNTDSSDGGSTDGGETNNSEGIGDKVANWLKGLNFNPKWTDPTDHF